MQMKHIKMLLSLDTSNNFQKPYITNPIDSVDDYEYNIVFTNEGNRALNQDLKNKLTSQYPMDWSVMPPNSAGFQEGAAGPAPRPVLEHYADLGMDSPYKEINSGYQPPDEDAQEAEEKKILSAYVPSRSQNSPGVYDIEDAKELIDKIYTARGLKAEVVQKPNNVYEVVGTQEINPKIVWEDQAPVRFGGSAAVSAAGEQTIEVPYSAGDPDKALDPYFDKKPSTNNGRWDYRQWTPGLERMFAPTQPQAAWY